MTPYVTPTSVSFEKVVVVLALLLTIFTLSSAVFVWDALALRKIKTEQAMRIWETDTFHASVVALRDGPRASTREETRSEAKSTDSFSRKKPFGDMVGIIVPRLYFRDLGGDGADEDDREGRGEGKDSDAGDGNKRCRIYSKVICCFVYD